MAESTGAAAAVVVVGPVDVVVAPGGADVVVSDTLALLPGSGPGVGGTVAGATEGGGTAAVTVVDVVLVVLDGGGGATVVVVDDGATLGGVSAAAAAIGTPPAPTVSDAASRITAQALPALRDRGVIGVAEQRHRRDFAARTLPDCPTDDGTWSELGAPFVAHF